MKEYSSATNFLRKLQRCKTTEQLKDLRHKLDAREDLDPILRRMCLAWLSDRFRLIAGAATVTAGRSSSASPESSTLLTDKETSALKQKIAELLTSTPGPTGAQNNKEQKHD